RIPARVCQVQVAKVVLVALQTQPTRESRKQRTKAGSLAQLGMQAYRQQMLDDLILRRLRVGRKSQPLEVGNGGVEEARVGEVSVDEGMFVQLPEHGADVVFDDEIPDLGEIPAEHLAGAFEEMTATVEELGIADCELD